MKIIKIALLGLLASTLCGCSGFFDKDNTPDPSPLVNFRTELNVQKLWRSSATSGMGEDYLKLVPAVSPTAVFTAGSGGTVTATDRRTGRTIWSVDTKADITSGPAANDGLVAVGTRKGQVIVLSQCDGKLLWQNCVSSEILAPPAIGNGYIIVKTIDGKVTGFSEQTGNPVWHYEQTEPLLILRGASAPQISRNNVVVGFANGNLARLSLRDGYSSWQQTVAIPDGSFAIQRMIDIDADPIIYNNKVYVGTYQGKVAALDFDSGRQRWSHDISTYSGIAADYDRVYVSDGKGHVWAFEAGSGNVDWRQTQLEARNISGPAVIGNYVVVGDQEGYLHFLCKQDGHFVARIKVDSSGIQAAPVVDNNVIYVVAKDGTLSAYTIG